MRELEGVQTWVELHLRQLHNGLDLKREATIWTSRGEIYSVSIEMTAHVQPDAESRQAGIWLPGDCLIAVSGIPYTSIQAGDLLGQEENAGERAPRKLSL